ncbi:MAG: helix-turn-helix domain-containing protein [Ectothiorhodospiraceae bacterium]|nr:helix-turn-helix domain-containing protein [Ectothiorhodospiraceae bacterium]MCH8503499.1 helix-turn-helix domain-containing protein [Ectothiorhodospiraceae bacterium]
MNTPGSVAILAFPEATASVMYGFHDLFLSAGRDWGVVVNGEPGPALFESRIVAVGAEPITIANGITITPDATLNETEAPDLICIPELLVTPSTPLDGRFETEVAWLKACHARGSIIATACSGSLLLAQTGLLDGETATTHWAYCEALAQRYPEVSVEPQRSLVAAGSGQRLIMAGGGSSWLDLGLFLIARLVNVETAMQMARLHLIDWHHSGQQPFASLAANCQTQDSVIAECQIWAARHYNEPAPVTAMTKLSGLGERTFTRRFIKATGMSPIHYIHAIRIEEAKQMLEATPMSLETIALELGYEDTSYFARLFKRDVGLTPAQYRRKFGNLRKVLREAVSDQATRTSTFSS